MANAGRERSQRRHPQEQEAAAENLVVSACWQPVDGRENAAVESVVSRRASAEAIGDIGRGSRGATWNDSFAGVAESPLLGVVRGVRNRYRDEARAPRRGDRDRGQLGDRSRWQYAANSCQVLGRRTADWRGSSPCWSSVGLTAWFDRPPCCFRSSATSKVALYLEEHETIARRARDHRGRGAVRRRASRTPRRRRYRAARRRSARARASPATAVRSTRASCSTTPAFSRR